MIEITVGYVAGFVAAAIVVAQIFCPTAIALILAGFLRDTETVATWNIAGRVLQRTWWPTILQSDSVQSHGARLMISLISWAVPIIAVLIAIAGVVTPLGLYEEIDTLGSRLGSFSYVKDSGSFGAATSQRGLHNFSRTCSWGHSLLDQGPAPCPYSESSVIVSGSNRTLNFTMPFGIDSQINPTAKEIFSSGTKGRTTISNFFDIEWRQLTARRRAFVDNGTEVAVGAYRQLESHIMDPSIKVVEGLIVDAANGGIGFRNHTIPTNIDRGASWSEDLLFVEPITSCVGLNLTLDFEVNYTVPSPSIDNLRLTDRGGFVNINRTYPFYNSENTQANPDLDGRAYKGAWLNNFWTMAYLNVTATSNKTVGRKAWSYVDSHLGKEFPLDVDVLTSYRGLGIGRFGSYLDLNHFTIGANPAANWSNPFGVDDRNFSDVEILCSGAGNADLANISHIYVGCGLLRGVPQRVDGGSKLAVYENHSKWSSPLYSCAAAVRAIVKTVTFTANGTDGLSSLKVTSIMPKKYRSPEDYPLWGMEDSGLSMDGISSIWGIISPEYASRPNISTVKQREFHIPGYSASLSLSELEPSLGSTTYNLPGSDFPSSVMKLLFPYNSNQGALNKEWPFDLAGASNMPIFERWQALSADATGISDVIKLLWTDLAASAVVGTKGTLGSINNVPEDAVEISIQVFGRRIKYHYAFGIPAFLLLLVMLSIMLVLLVTSISQSSTINVLRRRLQQLTVGRILTTILYPESSDLAMSSKEWSSANGSKTVLLNHAPQKAAVAEEENLTKYRADTPAEEVKVGLMTSDRRAE
ncbi:hypothetical protein CGCSCA1_v013212 [Colletotrichum siamense]|nr:hypothetical protein CGCSCA1_v013212 [Colletotrichum siamense]